MALRVGHQLEVDCLIPNGPSREVAVAVLATALRSEGASVEVAGDILDHTMGAAAAFERALPHPLTLFRSGRWFVTAEPTGLRVTSRLQYSPAILLPCVGVMLMAIAGFPVWAVLLAILWIAAFFGFMLARIPRWVQSLFAAVPEVTSLAT